MISLLPRHLKRYRDISHLLIKHGRSDLVQQSGLSDAFGDDLLFESETEEGKAEELASDLEAIGPTFVKLGQFLSTRPDLLPPAYLAALSRLQDDVEPISFEEVERVITLELGKRLDRAYAAFEREPLASASLGQVHRATTHEGVDVVVKIQRPDVRERIVDDLDALDDLAGVIDNHTDTGRRFQFQRIVELLRTTILRELDYRNEAENLLTIRKNMAEFESIKAPAPIMELTTSRVLTMEQVTGVKITEAPVHELDQLKREQLAEDLFKAYLHQVLVDGFFHADPHPGNLYLTTEGKIALLDLGMAVRVPPRLQEQLVKLMLASAEGQGEEAADTAIKIGRPRKEFDREEFHSRVTRLITDHRNDSLDRMPLGRMMLELQGAAADTGIQLPDEVLMLSKTLLHLEETLEKLDAQIELNGVIRDYATKILQRRATSNLTMSGLYQSALEMNELFSLLPRRANQILDMAANNKLRVNVDAVDEKLLIEGIQKIANRITMGLLLAALIVGASLMMDVDTPLKLFGYPVLSLFFLVTAGFGALVVIGQMFLYDRVRR